MLTRLLCVLALVASACAYETRVSPGAPDQCEVYAVGAGGEELGTVFVIDRKVYLRGGVSAEVARLTDEGDVVMQHADGWKTVGQFDGRILTMETADGTWTSGPLGQGRMVMRNDVQRMDFGHSPACTTADAAIGLAQAFRQALRAARPHEPSF